MQSHVLPRYPVTLKTHAPELELPTYAITILATHGWEQSHDPSFAHAALDSVCQRFRIPLEKANIDIPLVTEEWDVMLEYSKQYLNLFRKTTRSYGGIVQL